tara:strand:+ start:56 stop:736 length:681 start_codon:yes stop_codon:yes gene_type:complete
MTDNLGYMVPIWKIPDWTSNDIIKYVKYLISPLKVGHAGTLDPFAEGIVVLCVGKMTKKVNEVMDYEKEYIAEIKLGKRTDTLDCTGKINKIKKYKQADERVIINVLNQFKGEINQVPPMFSALKKNGQRLYSLARKGIVIEREARQVFIKDIKLISYSKNSISIKIKCGKGTYIRSLARDIAHLLKTEGYVEKLVRTKIGNFNEQNSINVKDFKDWLLSQRHIQN